MMLDDFEQRLEIFERRIGVRFNNRSLLREAFTHRSFLNEYRGLDIAHNERLEFLGDAVLELAVTDYLFHKYPEKDEGEMTSIRAALVNTVSISEAAKMWGMNEFLLLSRGEAKDQGKARDYILADAFEAVIGAIYLDQGFDAARGFIEKSLFHKTEAIVAGELWKDAKSRFQERAQEVTGITPSYRIIDEEGPDHQKHFTVGVFLGDEQVATGEGRSKQDAEQAAASRALLVKGWTPERTER